jgi:hypothetical protein
MLALACPFRNLFVTSCGGTGGNDDGSADEDDDAILPVQASDEGLQGLELLRCAVGEERNK